MGGGGEVREGRSDARVKLCLCIVHTLVCVVVVTRSCRCCCYTFVSLLSQVRVVVVTGSCCCHGFVSLLSQVISYYFIVGQDSW